MFHVALKFQYLHTFALATLKTPGGDPGIEAHHWCGDYAPPPQPEAPSAPASGAPPAPPVVAPARVPAPTAPIVVPDDSGVSRVSGVPPQPSHPRKSLKPKQKAMPRPEDSAKPPQPKIKAKPKAPPPTKSGVAGAK